MNRILPQRAKKYLLEATSNHTDDDLNLEFLNSLGTSENPASQQTFGGGAGFGMPGKKSKKSDSNDKDDVETLLFGTKKGYNPLSITHDDNESALSQAAELYASGKSLHMAADMIDAMSDAGIVGNALANQVTKIIPIKTLTHPILGPAVSGVLGGAAGKSASLLSGLLRSLGHMTGASYFEKNVEAIGPNQVANMVSGAGSPFAKLVIPGARRAEIDSKNNPFDPDVQYNKANEARNRAIEAAKQAEAVKTYRAKGYAIP